MKSNGNAHFMQAGTNKKAGKKSRKKKRKPANNNM
jgi:hypothetical protein